MDSNVSILEKQKIKARKPKQYKVIMHNDDFTTMEFVIDVLMNIFNKKFEEANKIMIDVHKKGKGIAGIYSYDIAVTKSSMAMTLAKEDGFPFKLSVEEV